MLGTEVLVFEVLGSERVKYVVCAAHTCVQFMKILAVYTLNSHVFTLKAHNHKMYVVFVVH